MICPECGKEAKLVLETDQSIADASNNESINFDFTLSTTCCGEEISVASLQLAVEEEDGEIRLLGFQSE